MGALVEQSIGTLFQGVSRQPDSVRLPGQVEDAVNVQFSVETGGFSQRFGTQHVAQLEGVSASAGIVTHVIDRDPTERYVVIKAANEDLRVYDIEGVEKTVNPYIGTYLNGSVDRFGFVSVADYTFILNKQRTVLMDPGVVAPTPDNIAVVQVVVSGFSGANYRVDVDGEFGDKDTAADDDTSEIADDIATELSAALGVDYSVVRVGSFIFIQRVDGADFVISQQSPNGDEAMILTKHTTTSSTKLPAKAPDGMVVRVETDGDGFYVKFHETEAGTNRGVWKETVQPGSLVSFDQDTMPHALIREMDGTFTIAPIDWNDKAVGDDDTVPLPEFVNRKISDLVFHRNRLALVADESAFFSQAGDYFNFWPEKSIEVLDSDPFGVTATTNTVSIMRYAVPFRKSLFLTSDNNQFEVSGDILTPNKMAIDLSTSYAISQGCRPITLGDELFFAAESGEEAAILNYIYDDQSLSNTANDITKHAKGFLPSSLVQMVGDPVTGNLFCLSSADRSSVFVYTFFYNGDERAQAAWGKWTFDGAFIHGMAVLGGYLFLVVRRGALTFLERITISVAGYSDYRFIPRCDRQVRVTGTYNPATEITTWALPYAVPPNMVGLTSDEFDEGFSGLEIIPTTIVADQLTLNGDWSDGDVLFGEQFVAEVELSAQYLRDTEGSIVSGRCQMRHMLLTYSDSGYFYAKVQPEARAERRHDKIERPVGAAYNLVQEIPIRSGTFRFPVQSRADTVRLRIGSDRFQPFTVVSSTWTGFFNEITRQE